MGRKKGDEGKEDLVTIPFKRIIAARWRRRRDI